MAIQHSHIFNLSYDNSDKLEKWGEDNTIVRKELLQFLVSEGIIDVQSHFCVHSKGKIVDTPIVIYPVKTTVIFKSKLSSDEIAKKIFTLRNKIFYVLTEVLEDEQSYLGKMRDDEELQANCIEELNEIIEEMK